MRERERERERESSGGWLEAGIGCTGSAAVIDWIRLSAAGW